MQRPDSDYAICAASDLAGLHPQTPRICERERTLQPARRVGGSRRYGGADVERLGLVGSLTTEELQLAGAEHVVALQQELAARRVAATEPTAELAQRRPTHGDR